MNDILIKNAVLIDPLKKSRKKGDILVKGDRIVSIGEDINEEAIQVIDAGGLYVSPGFTENHTHIYHGGGDCNINADVIMLPNLVTTAIDQGSSGWSNFLMFKKLMDTSMMNIKCFLNVSNSGLITEDYYENINPENFNEEMIRYTCEKYPDDIIGLKIRICRDSVLDMGTAPLERAVELAEDLNLPLSVHIKDVDSLEEYASLLRKGDTWVHIFQQQGQTAFDENGRLRKCVRDASERGVLFDIAGGRSSFSIDMIKKGKEQGFETDFIGTDLVSYNVYQRPLFSMVNMMNVYLNLGFDLYDIIEKVTVNPSRICGEEKDRASLEKGSTADLAVFEVREKDYEIRDNHSGIIRADRMIYPMMTVKEGKVVYRSMDF